MSKVIVAKDEDKGIEIYYYGARTAEKDRELDRLRQLYNVAATCESNHDKPDEIDGKDEIEDLKSRVRRLEKDVKWLKKVVRDLIGASNK